MRRKYLHRIEVNKSANTDDGYGGNTLTTTNLGNSWCNIKTIRKEKLVTFGLDVPVKAIEVKLRYRDDLDYEQEGLFFTYKSNNYRPIAITQEGLEEEEITIIAIAE